MKKNLAALPPLNKDPEKSCVYERSSSKADSGMISNFFTEIRFSVTSEDGKIEEYILENTMEEALKEICGGCEKTA